jgi:hypothetical protein
MQRNVIPFRNLLSAPAALIGVQPKSQWRMKAAIADWMKARLRTVKYQTPTAPAGIERGWCYDMVIDLGLAEISSTRGPIFGSKFGNYEKYLRLVKCFGTIRDRCRRIWAVQLTEPRQATNAGTTETESGCRSPLADRRGART